MSDTNPYESTSTSDSNLSTSDIRRPALGTFLIGLWLLEGGIKAFVLGGWLLRGFNPLLSLADDYHTWNRLVFFIVSAFFIVETIGPWIGIYYLTGRRSRTLPFGTALLHTLTVAGGVAIIATLLLMLYCEIAGTAAYRADL